MAQCVGKTVETGESSAYSERAEVMLPGRLFQTLVEILLLSLLYI